MHKIKYLTLAIIRSTVILAFLTANSVSAQGWNRLYIDQLPDTSFAVIEVDDTGDKYRHCAYRAVDGTIDPELLIYALGTFARETWIDPENKGIAKKRLDKEYQVWMNKIDAQISPTVDLNRADLTDLVKLPHIGPVLAVNIIEHRETHGQFETLDDVGKIKGIGQRTLNAIRYYVGMD